MEVLIHFNQRRISLTRKAVYLCIFAVFATSPLFGSEANYIPGEVTVFIDEYSSAYDANCLPVLFSPQSLVFGDPNQN